MKIFKKPLRKSYDEKIFGVCSGLANSLKIDVSWVRLFFVLFALYGAGLAVYIVLAIVLDYEDGDLKENRKQEKNETLNMKK